MNLRKKVLSFFLLFVFSYLFSGYSGNEAGVFLKFNSDPKLSSMGGSFLSKESKDGVNNPASLAHLYQPKLTFSHTGFGEDIKYSYFSYSSPFSFGNLGFGLGYLGYGEIRGINMNLEEYSIPQSYDMKFVISYANIIKSEVPVYREWGSVGTNLKFIKSQLAEYSAEAVALDLAAIINVGLLTGVEEIERLRAAIMYKNLGSKLKYVSKEYPLPASFSLGLGIDYPGLKNLEITTGIDLPHRSPSTYFFGLSIEPIYFLTFRFGYKYTKNSVSSGFTGGFGINLGSINFNYAVQQFREFSTLFNLGLIHQFSLEISLGGFSTGLVAAEAYFRRQLNTALEYYFMKEYDLAKKKLEEILSLSPDYKPAQQLIKKIETAQQQEEERRKKEVGVLLTKARISFDRKDYITSKKYYEIVLSIEPGNTDAKAGLEKVNEELAKIAQQKINQANAKKINKIWEEAVRYYKAGNFIQSREKFKEILSIDPTHEPTKRYLTDIEVQLSKLTAEQVNNLYLQGVQLFNNKRYLEALKYFEAVVLSAPDRLDAQEYLKKCEQAIKEEEERRKQEEIAKLQLENQKKMEETFNTALKLYEKLEYIKALDMFEKAKAIAIQYQFNDYLEKSNSYIETIKITLSDMYYKNGYKLYQQNKLEEAYNEYKKSLEYNPNNVAAEKELKRLGEQLAQKYYEMGISCYTRGEMEKAKEYFRRSLYYMPGKEETIRALERIR